MSLSIPDFEAKGWFLSQEGIDLIQQQHSEVKSLDDYLQCAKDMDLRSLTAQGFNKTKEKLAHIPSPVVLQVMEVRSIAIPSSSHADQPRRLLSVLFTDGKARYKGVESNAKLDCIKLHTPPGTKFLVTKPIEIKDRVLLLEPGTLKELGGTVQELVQAWRVGKNSNRRNRSRKPNKLQNSTEASAAAKNAKTKKTDAAGQDEAPKSEKPRKSTKSEGSTTKASNKGKENVDRVSIDNSKTESNKDAVDSPETSDLINTEKQTEADNVDESKAAETSIKKPRRKRKTATVPKDESLTAATNTSVNEVGASDSNAAAASGNDTDKTAIVESNDKEQKENKVSATTDDSAPSEEKENGEQPEQPKQRKTKNEARKEKISNNKGGKNANIDEKETVGASTEEQTKRPSLADSDDDFDINQIINSRRNKKKPQPRESRTKSAAPTRDSLKSTTNAEKADDTVSNKNATDALPVTDASPKKRKSRNKKKPSSAIETETATVSTVPAEENEAKSYVSAENNAHEVEKTEETSTEPANVPTLTTAADKKTSKKAKSKTSTKQSTKEKKQPAKKTAKKPVLDESQRQDQPAEKEADAAAEVLFDKDEISKDLAADFKPHFADRPSPRFQQRFERSTRYNNYNGSRRGGFYNNNKRPFRGSELQSQRYAKVAPLDESQRNKHQNDRSEAVNGSRSKNDGEKVADTDAEEGRKSEEKKSTEEQSTTTRPKRKSKKQREPKLTVTKALKTPKTAPPVRRSISSPVPSSTATGAEGESQQMESDDLQKHNMDKQSTLHSSTSEPSTVIKNHTIDEQMSQSQTQPGEKSESSSEELKSVPADPTSYADQPPPYQPISQQQTMAPYLPQQQQQQQPHDYYYAQQQTVSSQPQHSMTSMYPPYQGVVDYNMMIPVDPSTGMPATTPATAPIYNYDPHATYQMQMAAAAAQQPYIPALYYVPPEQQPYYMQPHYIQFYDQDRYPNTTPYYQQYQQSAYQYNSNHGYRNNRGGRSNSNNNANGVMTHDSSSNNSSSSLNNTTNNSTRNGKGTTK